ncbi:MAG: ABC transporter ATP-binding protein [Myxococcota bacterium]|jgi:ABC-2 type transport system ATP-binding protein|nr:ABC transporter ATP-binding protein [Myxococcota bacterium]
MNSALDQAPDAVIEVERLCKRFGAFLAVDAVSFEVRRGEIFGYLGANGAGKSTTIRMLCGLLRPSSGHATVAGFDIARQALMVKRNIGYVSQRFSLYLDLTVEQNLEFFGGAYGLSGKLLRERLANALQMSELSAHRKQLAGSLPGGSRQRLALASALLHRPPLLFLDEPTAGVSPDARRLFWRTIRELASEGHTLFVTTHHLDEAEYCGRVGLMVDGKLVALDTPAGLKYEHVPGTIFSVDTGGRHQSLVRALQGHPEVLQLEPFGARSHVRMRQRELSDAAFEALLRSVELGETDQAPNQQKLGGADQAPNQQEHPLPFERVSATLEDVFLALVRRSANNEEGA